MGAGVAAGAEAVDRPIPGTTQMPHMLENIGAAAVAFGAGELRELDTALDGLKIRGERLPAAVLAFSAVEARSR